MRNSVVSDSFGHHVWASKVLLDACLPLTAEQLATTVPGTYGSLIDTLRHLVGGDAGYLHLLSDGEVAEIDEASMDVGALRAEMDVVDRAWTDLLARDLDLDAEVVRDRDDGSKSFAPLSIRLAQVPHHGTDHRSQVATALTTLGIQPPDMDMWAFAESQRRLAKVPPPADLKRKCEDYAAAWRSMDPARVAAHFAPNGSLAVNGGTPAIGPEEIAATARGFYEALPDMQVFFDDLVVDGPRVEFHWTFTGTNTGPGGTGKAVRISGQEDWTLNDDGLIVRSLGHYDANEYARQLRDGI
ncbi:MAG TPA: DinB family protein [Candidatus Limnocylindrales bacterium]